MLVRRNGVAPRIASSAQVALSAVVVGDVTIGQGSWIDHGVVIESGGPSISIGREVIVSAGAVIRSVGAGLRPAFGVRIGDRTLIGLLSALAGCQVGEGCYVATGVMVFQGAVVGDYSRLGAGSIVHVGAILPEGSRVGLRQFAVQAETGHLITSDVAQARSAIAESDFFGTVFESTATDQATLHDEAMTKLLDEARGWTDEPVP